MTVENPIITSYGKAQHTSWKHLKDKTVYKVRMLLPWKCIITEYARNGGYMTIACKVLSESPLTVMRLVKGELMVLDIPIRCFERSWHGLPRLFKDNFEAEHSLDLTFEKRNFKDLRFKSIDRVKASKEEEDFAQVVYDNPRAYTQQKFKHDSESVRVEK